MITMIEDLEPSGDDRVMRLTIDIETAFCLPEDLEKEKSIIKPPSNVKKDDTKQAKIKEAQENIKDGLLDSNPIACIGIEADDELINFSWFSFSEDDEMRLFRMGVKVVTAKDEVNMLVAFRRWCDNNCDESTRTLTWNGYDFDLRRLRMAFARHHLRLPMILLPDAPNEHIDLMAKYAKYFTINNQCKKYVSLETACKIMNVDFEKSDIDGADFPRIIANEEYLRGTIYNMKDVRATSDIGDCMGY